MPKKITICRISIFFVQILLNRSKQQNLYCLHHFQYCFSKNIFLLIFHYYNKIDGEAEPETCWLNINLIINFHGVNSFEIVSVIQSHSLNESREVKKERENEEIALNKLTYRSFFQV